MAATAVAISMLPQLRKRALRQAIGSFQDADLATAAGRERVVQDVVRAYADYERRMLPPDARRLDVHRVEAIVRVAMRDSVAACA
jgi:hypothetical protein